MTMKSNRRGDDIEVTVLLSLSSRLHRIMQGTAETRFGEHRIQNLVQREQRGFGDGRERPGQISPYPELVDNELQ